MDLWKRTGGVHACALADGERPIIVAEDVGRHNAFDKVIGRAFLEGIDTADKLMLTTGRLSGEMVSKAVAARLALLVGRGAVTALAVDLARRHPRRGPRTNDLKKGGVPRRPRAYD